MEKGDDTMVTKLGKILRIMRINSGDSMRVMADKLDLSLSYLSAIENGKRNVPSDFDAKIIANYSLTEEEALELRDAIAISTESVKVNLTDLSEKQKKLIFALTKDEFGDATIDQLCEIIDKKNNK